MVDVEWAPRLLVRVALLNQHVLSNHLEVTNTRYLLAFTLQLTHLNSPLRRNQVVSVFLRVKLVKSSRIRRVDLNLVEQGHHVIAVFWGLR